MEEPIMKRLLALCIKVLSLSSLLPAICLAAASPSYTITGDALLNGGGTTASSLYTIHGSALGQAFFNPTGSMGSPSNNAGVLALGNPQQADRQHTLIVAFRGSGYGKITGDAGLLCVGTDGNSRNINLLYSTALNLTATPLISSTFAGWSGDCTGTGACQVTMGIDRKCYCALYQQNLHHQCISRCSWQHNPYQHCQSWRFGDLQRNTR
jgi:hypothetical protein